MGFLMVFGVSKKILSKFQPKVGCGEVVGAKHGTDSSSFLPAGHAPCAAPVSPAPKA